MTRFRTAADFREFFAARYGPTTSVYRAQQDTADRAAALDAALEELAAGRWARTGRWNGSTCC